MEPPFHPINIIPQPHSHRQYGMILNKDNMRHALHAKSTRNLRSMQERTAKCSIEFMFHRGFPRTHVVVAAVFVHDQQVTGLNGPIEGVQGR